MSIYDPALLIQLRKLLGDNQRRAYRDDATLVRLLDEVDGDLDAAVERGLYYIVAGHSIFPNEPGGFSVEDQAAMRQAAADTLRLWRQGVRQTATDVGGSDPEAGWTGGLTYSTGPGRRGGSA